MLEMVILGVVQGLTEFLPVSSTAHLLFAEALLGVARPGILLESILHLGTAFAAVLLFWPDVRRLLAAWWLSLARRPEPEALRGYGRLAWVIVVISLITAVVGFALAVPLERMFGSLRGTAVQLIVTGLILLAARGAEHRAMTAAGFGDGVALGLAQAASIIPGISRSGSTIAAALWFGFRREDAARLSFLSAIPAVAGAGVFGLKDLRLGESFGHSSGQLLVGFVVALLSGALAMRWLLVVMRRNQLNWFAAYCIAAGVIALITIGR